MASAKPATRRTRTRAKQTGPRFLAFNVLVRHPQTHETHHLQPGDELPSWAESLVSEANLAPVGQPETPSADEAPPSAEDPGEEPAPSEPVKVEETLEVTPAEPEIEAAPGTAGTFDTE